MSDKVLFEANKYLLYDTTKENELMLYAIKLKIINDSLKAIYQAFSNLEDNEVYDNNDDLQFYCEI